MYNKTIVIMPIYEYKCSKCGSIFEHFQKITDSELDTCQICGSQNTVVKIISSSGFRLNGTGWYETDFKNKQKPNDSNTGKKETTQKKSVK